jgi:dihydroflavonol-4-reductase
VPAGSRRHSAYDLSKADGERRVREVMARGLDGVLLHPTSVIGPADPEPSRMGRVFLALRDRRLPALVAGGFDFVDVRDVVDGLVAAAGRGATGSSYLLGGEHATVSRLAAVASRATGVRAPRIGVPAAVARLGTPFAALAGRLRHAEPLYTAESLRALGFASEVDSTAAARDLGYRSRPLEETVEDLYRWFEDAGM